MVFIVAMLSLSLVSAAIDEDMVTTQEKGIRERVEQTKEEVVRTTENVQERVQETKELVQERAEIVQERVELAQRNYQEAKNQYYQQKNQYLDLRSAWNNCRVKDNEDCQEIRQKLNKGVKMHALNFNNMMDGSLNRIQRRIETSDYLENKDELLEEIEQFRKQLENKKVELEKLEDTATTEEYKAKIDEVKELWTEIRFREREMVQDMIKQKTNNVAEQLEENTLKAMKQKNRNNPIIEQFQEKIMTIKESNDQKEIRQTINEARELLREFMAEHNRGSENDQVSN